MSEESMMVGIPQLSPTIFAVLRAIG